MTSTYVFIAGSFVFAGTVWGSLMVGAVALGQRMGEQSDEQSDDQSENQDGKQS